MAERPTLPELAGTLPDAEVAALADASVAQVLAYRRAHAIPPFVRSPPGRAPADVARTVSTGEAVPEYLNEEDLPDEPEAPPERPAADTGPVPEDEPARPEQKRRGRLPMAEGRLAAYADQLGRISDGDIAEQAGLSLGTVGAYRRKLGIPAYAGFLWQKGHEPVGGGRKKTKSPAPARGRRADIDRLSDLVGTVPDRVVAEQAGVSRSAVTAWRREQGVAAAHPHVRSSPAGAPEREVRERGSRTGHVASRASGGAGAPTLAFSAVVRREEEELSFVVLGADFAVAAARALAALADRPDGPWELRALEVLGEAIEARA